MPPFSTGDFNASASSSALRLSPVPDVLSLTVNVSPTAGAPEICTRQPLTSMSSPAAYGKLPAPLIEYVFALVNSMVTDVRSCAFVLSSTSPAEMEPEPEFPASAPVRIGAAAAMRDGSETSTSMSATAPRVGRIRNVSPTSAAPPTSISRPSATNGSAAVPVPVIGTAAPVRESRNSQPPPVISRM